MDLSVLQSIQRPIQPQEAVNPGSGANGVQRIAQVIKQASARTGVDFSYLLNKASQESSLDPNAKASSSSATGLFQFTQQTWLKMVKEHGDEYGLGDYADKIKLDMRGVAKVTDPAARTAILDLRKDPSVSAEMAGELAKENLAALKANVGGKIGPTELYLAHFLGAGGASEFINAMREDPHATAADILPTAAASNPNVFYGKDGEARSVAQIYKHFAQKFDRAPVLPAGSADIQVAQAAPPVSYNVSGVASTASYNVASSAPIRITAPVSASIQSAGASSLFATMVLAQADIGSGAGSDNDRDEKKSALAQLLGGVA